MNTDQSMVQPNQAAARSLRLPFIPARRRFAAGTDRGPAGIVKGIAAFIPALMICLAF